MRTGIARRLVFMGFLAAVIPAAPRGAPAQQAPAPTPAVGTEAPPLAVSPRGAFVRAALVPGWGHAAIGAYTRGGFYFALETLTAYTFLRTRTRLTDARERAGFREAFLRATLAQEGVTDPAQIESRLEQDGALQGLEDLAKSRERQQEDLVAFSIFLLFLSGADAFVSAHLARFPTPIQVEAAIEGGGAEVAIRVMLPR